MAGLPYSGPIDAPAPDHLAMRAFIDYWFHECNHGLMEIGWTDPDGSGIRHFEKFELKDAAALVTRAAQENLVPGQSMYIRASTISGAKYYTTDAEFTQAPGLWSDMDDEADIERAKLVESRIRPTAYVITGTVPTLRVQSWFRADLPLLDGAAVRDLNARLHALYGGDRSVVNPTRLMRLPGSIAWPWKPGRVPEVVRLTWPTDGRPSSIPAINFSALLPPATGLGSGNSHGSGDPASGATMPPPWPSGAAANGNAGSSGGGLNTFEQFNRAIRSGRGGWHNAMVQLVARLVGLGRSNAEIMALCEGWTLPPWTHDATRKEVAKAITGARTKWSVPDPEPELWDQPKAEYPATPIETVDLVNIPPRQWIYERELVRAFVSVLAGSGGVGKTAYAMTVAVAVATGRTLLEQFHPCKSGPVWVVNLEDPMDELRRRLRAILDAHDVKAAELAGKFFLTSGRDQPLVVAIRDKGALIVAPVVKPLIAELKRRGITLLIIDPFVQSHEGEENRNDEMNKVMTAWGWVAAEADCAIWLIHHFRKGGAGGDADAVRGAVAIQGATRAMHTLSVMSLAEAKALGIEPEEKWRFVRHDDVKSNMAPGAGRARWFQLESRALGNATLAYPEGDSAQVMRNWSPPRLFEGVDWATIIAILTEIDRGPGDGEFYSFSRQARERWAGGAIMRLAGKSPIQATDLLAIWEHEGLLVSGEYMSPRQRKPRSCVRVDQGKFSEMRQQENADDSRAPFSC
jgi:hypothetical protein